MYILLIVYQSIINSVSFLTDDTLNISLYTIHYVA